MAINTGSHPKALWPGVKAFFGKSYDEKPDTYSQVFDKYTSDKSYEEYVEETGFGLAPVKPEGDSTSYDTDQQGYISRLTNVTYSLGAKVTMEAIDDNQYENVARSKARKLARSMKQTKENVFANVLNRGYNASFPGGDGVALLSNAHPTLSGNQSNILAVAADLSEAAVEDALTLIRQMRDSRGLRIQAKGMKLVLPPELEFEGTRIVSSANQSGTANNDINAMKSMERYAAGWADWRGIVGSDGA
jgi:hypothetical protein